MLRRPLLTALFAGLISATGFAPLNLWPLLLLGLAVLLHLVHEAPRLRAALARGWMFGLGHFAVGNNWMQHAFDYQDKLPPALGYLAVLLVACYLAIFPAVACGLAWRFKAAVRIHAGWEGPDSAYVLAAAAAWMVSEGLRATLFTGYPWDPIGLGWLTVDPVAQGAALIGTYALSGVMMLAAGALYLLWFRNYHFAASVAASLVALALLGTAHAPEIPRTAESPPQLRVRIVQPNIGQEALHDPDYNEKVLARMIALSKGASLEPRLLIWPEGMVNDLIEDGYPDPRWYRVDPRIVRARIGATLGPLDTALIGGNALFFDDKGRITGAGNSIWPVDPSGMLGKRYDKAHLVPFGEYLPARPFFEALGIARFAAGDVDFVRGPGPQTIEINGVGKVGMLICYEVIFSGQVVDPLERPDFIFNPSNDAWFGSWGPAQHLAQARMRAIEEGLPILRATPTGISAVIDARGHVVASIPHLEEGAVDALLPAPRPPTLFARIGNAAAAAMALLLLLFAFAIRRFAR
ncbi:apolipoprotein N-acyltransferase [Sphingomonas sp. LB-2]|uniref:apolipoprotein N-acyltransferase n=1 Tax=Sphingomonas caeni TaxID=2984949 RepID=UPI00223235C5|nr:apolipoprotein N-acyltransferase [Sphingomonas caeni]MCW3847973.1 apolipoprotein N-acyltransferase [Sphingomonas caeni]